VNNPKLVIRIEPSRNLQTKELGEVKEIISWCLGLKEDYRAFYEMCEKDRILKAAMESQYSSKGKSYPTVFEAIIGVICAQNIQFKRLYSMMYKTYVLNLEKGSKSTGRIILAFHLHKIFQKFLYQQLENVKLVIEINS